MNASDPRRKRSDAAPREPGFANVIPFPRGGRDGRPLRDANWTFTTDVRWVDGAEAEWLRRELGSVVRELLVWACDDMPNSGDGEQGEERRAA